jgi:hypothetical protein
LRRSPHANRVRHSCAFHAATVDPARERDDQPMTNMKALRL